MVGSSPRNLTSINHYSTSTLIIVKAHSLIICLESCGSLLSSYLYPVILVPDGNGVKIKCAMLPDFKFSTKRHSNNTVLIGVMGVVIKENVNCARCVA